MCKLVCDPPLLSVGWTKWLSPKKADYSKSDVVSPPVLGNKGHGVSFGSSYLLWCKAIQDKRLRAASSENQARHWVLAQQRAENWCLSATNEWAWKLILPQWTLELNLTLTIASTVYNTAPAYAFTEALCEWDPDSIWASCAQIPNKLKKVLFYATKFWYKLLHSNK
jgi:hypothetical protein